MSWFTKLRDKGREVVSNTSGSVVDGVSRTVSSASQAAASTGGSGINYLKSDGAAYLTPLFAIATEEGRQNVFDVYGKYAQDYITNNFGEQAGGVFSGLTSRYAQTGEEIAGTSSGGGSTSSGFSPIASSPVSGGLPWWAIPVVGGLVVVGLIVYLARRGKGRGR